MSAASKTRLAGTRRDSLKTVAACVLGTALGTPAVRTARAQATDAPRSSAALPGPSLRAVGRAELLEAFAAQSRLGYRMDRMGHAARMQTGVLLHLAESAATLSGPTPVQGLFIDHRLYESCYRTTTGLARDQLPAFVREAADAGEDIVVDLRPEAVLDGPAPPGLRRAVNVKAGWPAAPGAPTSYRYLDTSSQPHVETVRDQVGAWRLLDYGEFIVQDDITGVAGRARSGVLGALFSLLGNAQVTHSRFAPLADGSLVVHTRVRSAVSVSRSAFVTADGEVLASLPEERGDLHKLEARLLALNLPMHYRSMDRSPMGARTAGN